MTERLHSPEGGRSAGRLYRDAAAFPKRKAARLAASLCSPKSAALAAWTRRLFPEENARRISA
jgi:hypothetical protein